MPAPSPSLFQQRGGIAVPDASLGRPSPAWTALSRLAQDRLTGHLHPTIPSSRANSCRKSLAMPLSRPPHPPQNHQPTDSGGSPGLDSITGPWSRARSEALTESGRRRTCPPPDPSRPARYPPGTSGEISTRRWRTISAAPGTTPRSRTSYSSSSSTRPGRRPWTPGSEWRGTRLLSTRGGASTQGSAHGSS